MSKRKTFRRVKVGNRGYHAGKRQAMFLPHVPSHYAPDDLVHEAIICSTPSVYRGVNMGKADVTAITLGMGLSRAAFCNLDEIAARWSNPGKVEVKQLPPL